MSSLALLRIGNRLHNVQLFARSSAFLSAHSAAGVVEGAPQLGGNLRCPRSALTKGPGESQCLHQCWGDLPRLLFQGHTSFSQCRYHRVQKLFVPGSPVVRGIVQGIVSVGDESQRPQECPIQCRSIEVALHEDNKQAGINTPPAGP